MLNDDSLDRIEAARQRHDDILERAAAVASDAARAAIERSHAVRDGHRKYLEARALKTAQVAE